jgi:RND family efflux transporter MFP subunit
MKKLIWIIIAGLLFVSCSDQSSNDTEKIKKEISNYREEIAGLNDKIAELEKQLAEAGDPEEQKKGVMIRVEKAQIRSFSEYFEATGELEAEDEAYISPETPGQIAKIYVVEGQKVKKGQLLAKLNTDLIERNIDELKTQLNFAQTMFDKQKELWDKNIGSERQYLDAKNKLETLQNKLQTLETQYKRSMIYTPVNGYVEEIFQKEGEQASPGLQMMQVVGLDKLKVTANISEAYLPVIHEGDTVEITFPTYPGLVMYRPISRIGHVVSKQNRTFKVQVYINNKKGLLKPNLLASVKINNYNSDNHIVIPSRVVREDLKGAYLYVALKDGKRWVARKKYITLGKSYRNKSEVVLGLDPGDLIITDGFNNVADGTILTITE